MERMLKTPAYTMKTIWGIAKSKELSLTQEELYALIYRETEKAHMKELTQGEINKVCMTLYKMKDGCLRRTDRGGNPATITQRKKIYQLTQELGWNNDNRRIHGFVKKTFGIDRLEWLDKKQCWQLIETLKKMVQRDYGVGEEEG